MAEELSPTLRAVSDAVLSIAAERSVEEVLQRLVESARELAGARYAALGTTDGEGGFSRFLTAGMSDGLVATLGDLPRTHGMLGAMLETAESFRTPDIHDDRRFRGWWPKGHPDMRSFLGVPISAREDVIGAFYPTEEIGTSDFSVADQELIELLAAHAAIAITNARLYEQSRELSILSERNRLALELHDAVSQKLFSLVLIAEAAATLVGRDSAAAGEQLGKLKALAQEAHEELRALIWSRVDVSPSTVRSYGAHLLRLNPKFDDRDPASITAADVREWVAENMDLGPASLGRYVITLRQVLDFAGVKPNPARDKSVKLPKVEKKIVVPPSGEQVEAILAHVPERRRLPLRVLEQTGMRVGELHELEWQDVEVVGSRFRLRKGKTAAARR
jgi:GAF domain-containing protein